MPHDMGNPGDSPWNRVNSYNIQDISRWKDLPSKFVLQVYRDYVITKDLKFLKDLWPAVLATMEYATQFDLDGDGVLDNEGFPDQTYDTWSAVGCSAYSGGLWLAALEATIAMTRLTGATDKGEKFSEILKKGKKSFHDKLWNGKYYNYDSSGNPQHNSIMADMMAGQWYARACGLDPIVPDENAYSALKTVFNFNVKGYKHGSLGAINGMRPDGTPDHTCMQSLEVWTGTSPSLGQLTSTRHNLRSGGGHVAARAHGRGFRDGSRDHQLHLRDSGLPLPDSRGLGQQRALQGVRLHEAVGHLVHSVGVEPILHRGAS